MYTVKDIGWAIQTLEPTELAAFRAWFAEYDADAWDRQFDDDVTAGRLDALADEALADSPVLCMLFVCSAERS